MVTPPVGHGAAINAFFLTTQLYKHDFPSEGRTPYQNDAYCISAWLRQMDMSGQLEKYLKLNLSAPEKGVAGVEGWILGVL